jgi:hypothetical protein
MSYWMRQCTLKRATAWHTSEQVSWIPEKFAKVGKVVKLKEDGEWEDGWVVVHVGARKESHEVHAASHGHTKHRKRTDI